MRERASVKIQKNLKKSVNEREKKSQTNPTYRSRRGGFEFGERERGRRVYLSLACQPHGLSKDFFDGLAFEPIGG